MNPVNLVPTNTTPAIVFKDDILLIKGRSIPLSDAKFYDPFIAWAETFGSGKLTVEINLEYMNSSSSKKLLLLLRTLDSNAALHDFTINWYYEEGDEEFKEQGKVFERLLKKAKFSFVALSDSR